MDLRFPPSLGRTYSSPPQCPEKIDVDSIPIRRVHTSRIKVVPKVKLSNFRATKLIKNLYSKDSNKSGLSEVDRHKMVHSALSIYKDVDEAPNGYLINTYLKLCLHCKQHHGAMHIWDDVVALLQGSTDVAISYPLLLSAFGRNSLNYAQRVFECIPDGHLCAVSVGLMMKYYIQNGVPSKALALYNDLDKCAGTDPNVARDDGAHSLALKACIQCSEYEIGRRIHSEIGEYIDLHQRVHLKTTLIEFYHHFGAHSVAKEIFESIPPLQRDAVCTSTMMKGLIDSGHHRGALTLYDAMCHDAVRSKVWNAPNGPRRSRDDICDTLAIKACIHIGDWRRGKEIHRRIEHLLSDHQIHLKNILINLYGESGDLQTARTIFESIASGRRDIAVVNAMMKVLIHNDCGKEALALYDSIVSIDGFSERPGAVPMRAPQRMKTNHISHLMAIRACTVTGDADRGRAIHCMVEREGISNIQIESALIDFHGHCGDIDSALAVFGRIGNSRRNVVALNAMMTAFNDNECFAEALALYDDGRYAEIERDGTTKMLAIKSCTNLREFERGIAIHSEFAGDALSVAMTTTLIALYGHSGDIGTAQRLFASIASDRRDIYCIGTMLEALCNNGMNAECISMFEGLGQSHPGVVPDVVAYVTVLKACTNATSLSIGRRIHEELKLNVHPRIWRHKNIQIHLINMYGKCAMVEDCERILAEIEEREDEAYRSEIGIWNAMVLAYGRNGDLENAKRVYAQIQSGGESGGLAADRKTFILMITACSHHGDIGEAQRIWNEDIVDEEVKYDEYVVSSIVDCFARSGQLEEAMQLILKHHCDCKVMWMSLLSGCRKHGDEAMTPRVFAEIERRFPDDRSLITSASILLSNVMGSSPSPHWAHV